MTSPDFILAARYAHALNALVAASEGWSDVIDLDLTGRTSDRLAWTWSEERLTRSIDHVDSWLIDLLGFEDADRLDPAIDVDPASWACVLRDCVWDGARVCWVLGSELPATRLSRVLTLELSYAESLRRAQASAGLSTASAALRVSRIRTLAQAHGLDLHGQIPYRRILEHAGGLSAVGSSLRSVHLLLDSITDGSRDALTSLGAIAIRDRHASLAPPRPGDASAGEPSAGRGFLVAVAATTSLISEATRLYECREIGAARSLTAVACRAPA